MLFWKSQIQVPSKMSLRSWKEWKS